MAKNLPNGFDWGPVVVQPGTETTAESVEAVPVNSRAFERSLDVLGPKRSQIEREDSRILEDPRRARIRFPMLFQFRDHLAPLTAVRLRKWKGCVAEFPS